MPGANDAAARFGGALPEEGVGTRAAVEQLLAQGLEAHIRSAGPRFFNWVIGGSTPAALAADWMASLIDQNAGPWDGSPLSAQLERVSLRWLLELFELPPEWGGVLTTGATMAHFAALTTARRWWGERHGANVDADGLSALPPMPVFSSGFIHPSAVKTLGMLGIGRDQVRICAADETGRLDAGALEDGLKALDGAPAIVIANAGEISAGHFDPVAVMADLAKEHGAWLHVDGAFGLFARLSPRTRELTEGVERADSVVADGHKWLNVPHDCGFAFVRDAAALGK
ncbi:MAG: aminotransferase class V-fold PLP-dependent enzyme, partial [Actinobacteria bacterium]|nr:aminotransferase class V-fold PLP-dependent enzyme [Actinomycetota bacterium]